MRATGILAALSAALFAGGRAVAADEALNPIPLPKPQIEGGMPLMRALKEQQTSRSFSPEKLPQQLLSNLLWAADGVNRPDGKRTAPTASV